MGKVLPAAPGVFSPLMNMVVGSFAVGFCSGMVCLRRGEGGGAIWLALLEFVLLLASGGAFPCFACGLLAFPCAGGTYFSLPPQRKVGKRKRLKPPLLSGSRGSQKVVVHLESGFSHI